ncbi:MAG TPA: ATP-binding protein [Trichocoleus sp.]
MLLVDPVLIRRVIENLLSNAIKFSPLKGQITIRASLNSAGKTVIQVIDQGRGVPAEAKQAIFQKYEIGKKVFNVRQIGLGLAFCKMVVEAHQGRIYVEDACPVGSIFTFELMSASDRQTN